MEFQQIQLLIRNNNWLSFRQKQNKETNYQTTFTITITISTLA